MAAGRDIRIVNDLPRLCDDNVHIWQRLSSQQPLPSIQIRFLGRACDLSIAGNTWTTCSQVIQISSQNGELR